VISKVKPYFIPLIISVACYIYFFFPLLKSENIIYSGGDSVRLHYASRLYLYDNLTNQQFPFWTERMFEGYPIFSDLERGYQNLPNVILVYLFGPFNSYKLLHFVLYLLGSLSLYLLLKTKLDKVIFFLPINLLYFFSFMMLIHQQHFNIILTFYLLPLIIYLTDLYCKRVNYKIPILLSFIYYFCITLGSLQSVLIVLAIQLIYFGLYSDLSTIKPFLISFFVLTTLVSLPSIYTFYQIYINSQRAVVDISGTGNFDMYLLIQTIYPFSYGIENFYIEQIDALYRKNEHSLYIGISIIFISIYAFLATKLTKIKVLSILTICFFLLSNFLLLPPFSLFRYWVRSEFAVSFLFCILIAEYYSSNSFILQSKKFLKVILILLLIAFIPIFLNKDILYIFKKAVLEDLSISIIWAFLFVSTLIILLTKFKYKEYLITFLIVFDILFFTSKLDSNMITKVQEIKYEPILSSIPIYNNVESDDYSLLRNVVSTSGYSVLTPLVQEETKKAELRSKLSFEKLLPLYLIFYFLYILAMYTFIKYNKHFYEYFKSGKRI